MENAGIFYGHWEYFTVIWYILWLFGNVVVIWYIFPRFGILCQKNLATLVLIVESENGANSKKSLNLKTNYPV
jgi:hypothetical protein